MPKEVTAALIVVGNEILSGKVQDTNSAFLAREVRDLGVWLRRIIVVPDEVDAIAEAVRDCASRFDVVFTSGGIGPTHDDVTVQGVAQGLGRRVVEHPGLAERLREFFGGELTGARRKMAEVVEGAELIFDGDRSFPTIRVANVYLLPGIPEIFREKLRSLRNRFAGNPFHMRTVYVRAYESQIAEALQRTLDDFPELLLGSYPKLNHPEYSVQVTLESKDPDYLERSFRRLMELLPADVVVRTE